MSVGTHHVDELDSLIGDMIERHEALFQENDLLKDRIRMLESSQREFKKRLETIVTTFKAENT
jgi:hypothetical protein